MRKLKKGARCIACPGGPWVEMTVTRCNEDGTYDLMPVDSDSFLDEWEGVTRPEISADEKALWPGVFAKLRGKSKGIGLAEATHALEGLGIQLTPKEMRRFWAQGCKAKLGIKKGADTAVLDKAQAYQFFLGAGFSAKQFSEPAPRDGGLFKLYWNDIRMGGRDPEDVGRPIGLKDALASLGLARAPSDAAAVKALATFERKNKLQLPTTLKALWSRKGALAAICDAHCNNPEPEEAPSWKLLRDTRETTSRAFAVRIMLPHQGDHAWWAAFDDGAKDAAIWLSFEEDGPPARLVAPSVPLFFWDLAETGHHWELKEAEEEAEDEA